MSSFRKPSIQSLNIEKLNKMSDLNNFFKLEKEIGKGSYGLVYKAIDLKNKTVKALKINFKRKTGDLSKNYNEASILKNIYHPNIIVLEKVFENKNRLCLVLEYCSKTLNEILLEMKKLPEEDTHCIMKYLTSAVGYLHSNGIVHRDLKIENILIGENPDNPNDQWFIKIIDFELSTVRKNVFKTNESNEDYMEIIQPNYSEFCGTIQYIAPELYGRVFSEKCDIWSIGVIMYLLLVGKYPFAVTVKNIDSAKDVIMNSSINYDDIKCSDAAKQLIKKCLNINPIKRISAGEISIDEWIAGKHNRKEKSFNVTNIVSLMDQYNEKNLKIKSNKKSTIERDFFKNTLHKTEQDDRDVLNILNESIIDNDKITRERDIFLTDHLFEENASISSKQKKQNKNEKSSNLINTITLMNQYEKNGSLRRSKIKAEISNEKNLSISQKQSFSQVKFSSQI